MKGGIMNHYLQYGKKKIQLFWCSPGKKSYYNKNYINIKLQTTKSLKGILLQTSPSDFECLFKNIKKYKNLHTNDAFCNLWYAILEDNLMDFEIDFINLYNNELIFSNKNLRFLNEIK
jgi:hypothetical protein